MAGEALQATQKGDLWGGRTGVRAEAASLGAIACCACYCSRPLETLTRNCNAHDSMHRQLPIQQQQHLTLRAA